eukprot:1160717-Rhodomonas_salina.1
MDSRAIREEQVHWRYHPSETGAELRQPLCTFQKLGDQGLDRSLLWCCATSSANLLREQRRGGGVEQ